MSDWKLIHEAGDNAELRVFIDQESVKFDKDNVLLKVKYALQPYVMDGEKKKEISEILTTEEYNCRSKTTRSHESIIFYADQTQSEPRIPNNSKWSSAIHSHERILEYLIERLKLIDPNYPL